MADISQYLQDILDAVYGEDVRGSIHDAIELINDVSEVVISAGTLITNASSSSTGFYTDSFYFNTNTYDLWKCIGTDSWDVVANLKGTGISSVTKTGTSGNVDTYTIAFDDGSSTTFTVTNGIDGTNGSTWYKGTAITGYGSGIVGFPGTQNDFYLNSTTGAVYVCTKSGGAIVPDAAEWDYVMTISGGGGGSPITVIDNLTSASSTDALSANQGRVLNNLISGKADAASLANVATSGSYNDLSNKPAIDSFIGPSYATVTSNVYSVVFDDLDDNYGYELCMNDAIGKWTNVTKGTGTNSGIKLTYTLNPTYIKTTNGTSATISAGVTPFYLRAMK